MCGIVGYIGKQEASPIIIDGLRRLEYRGYDSAGICTLNGAGAQIYRAQGKLLNLENILRDTPATGTPRHWSYPLGDPWAPFGGQRPSA